MIRHDNEIVEKIAAINFTGNVIPHIWYKKILRENGKPYHLAIFLLSDIVYWYRPVEVRDEATGNVIGFKKKFKGDLFQKSYDQYAESLGESSRSIKAALKHLEDMGLILRVFRTITLDNDMRVPNVMYIALNSERLLEITHPRMTGEGEKAENKRNNDSVEKLCSDDDVRTLHEPGQDKDLKEETEKVDTEREEEGATKESQEYDKIMRDVVQNFVTPPTKDCHIPPQENATPPTAVCQTNTENTTENTNRDYPINHSTTSADSMLLSGGKAKVDVNDLDDPLILQSVYTDMIRDNVDYSSLILEYPDDVERIDELIRVMVNVICFGEKEYSINRCKVPAKVIALQFCKLDREHMVYALSSLKKANTKLTNPEAYMVATLYTARNTALNDTLQQFNHDTRGSSKDPAPQVEKKNDIDWDKLVDSL